MQSDSSSKALCRVSGVFRSILAMDDCIVCHIYTHGARNLKKCVKPLVKTPIHLGSKYGFLGRDILSDKQINLYA